MIATTDLARSSASPGPAGRIPHPCDACKRSKLKCDQRRPTCDTCSKRDKICEYSTADGYTDGRVRKFHRRSRNGCSHCKARRVRCDEVKPVCGGCRRKGSAELCIFAPDTERSSHSKSPTPPAQFRSQHPEQSARLYGGEASRDNHVAATGTAGSTEAAQHLTGCAPESASQSYGQDANGGEAQRYNHLPAISATGSTAAAQRFTGCAPVSASQTVGQSATGVLSSHNADYFSQQIDPLLAPTTDDLTNPLASNALSLWNPSAISAASPNTLLASFFGTQATDSFQPASIYDLPMDSLKPDNLQHLYPAYDNEMTSAHKFFAFDLGRTDPSASLADLEVNGNLGNLTDFDPFSMEATGSTGSTPISLNSNTAYNANLANFVRAEYRNRPEHPAYLYQLQVIEDMEQLTPYFPSLEQRHQFRHFFLETSKSLLVTPTPQHANPFLCHFSHLALGAPSGQSLSHDAFRFALLSLASLDIGIKMSMAMAGMSQNAMYSTSDEQRTEAHKRLIAASISGILKEDPADAELAIATVIAMSIRDRLAGCQEWEPPLQIARDVVVDAGGAAAFINARPTADRRFLVEQMAVLELIGYLTIWVSPKLLAWDNEWFKFYTGEEDQDHLQVVYGWTRQVILYAARSMILCGEARDIEAMREAQPKPGYRRLKEIIEMRMTSLVKRVKDFLPEGEIVKATAMTSQYTPEVLVGVLGIQACMDLCLRTVILMEDIKSTQVQNLVKSILDMSDESISRGRFAGLLLPLSWADGVAFDPILKQRAKTTLKSLKGRYHLNQELLERIINIDWATLNDIGLGDWEAFLRKHGYYVPCF